MASLHRYNAAGAYSVAITIADGKGGVATATSSCLEFAGCEVALTLVASGIGFGSYWEDKGNHAGVNVLVKYYFGDTPSCGQVAAAPREHDKEMRR